VTNLNDRLRKAPWAVRHGYGAKVASDLRRLSVVATHRHCHVEFRGPVRLGPGFMLRIPDRGTLVVGAGVEFRHGFVCEISGDGRVTIGDLSCFTSHALVQCSTSIDIGRRCVFGQSALLVDGAHRFRDPNRPIAEQGYDYRPLRIGDGVMVMAKCTIFAGIGDGTVVGAHSVVSRPLPPRCLSLGAPARPVEFFEGPAVDGSSETRKSSPWSTEGYRATAEGPGEGAETAPELLGDAAGSTR
jgi:acetyltransferase-like isoleucine patch superfamily enzyme